MKEKVELLEVDNEQLEIELKTSVFLDDIRIFCTKFKLPETFIEEKFFSKEDLPKRILRTIFTQQPLSKPFLVKHSEKYEDVWLATNPNISKELIEELEVIKRLTGTHVEE